MYFLKKAWKMALPAKKYVIFPTFFLLRSSLTEPFSAKSAERNGCHQPPGTF
jgi:regulator of sirC expression with transglutaminase-like and TPR domain